MALNKKSIEDIDVKGKKVLARCDFNVPLDGDGNITDDKRIVRSPRPPSNTCWTTRRKAHPVLPSGPPEGRVQYEVLPQAPVAARLSELLGKEVPDGRTTSSAKAPRALAASLQDGRVLCCLRTSASTRRRRRTIPAFADELASMAEIYVNDAFGTAHRAHASTAGVTDYLPAVCGYLHPEGDRRHGRRAGKSRNAPLSPSSAARRCPTKSA